MPVPVIMPKLEMSQETSTVVEWLKQEGEHVEKGEPLLTVETDKVTVDIESPATGTLAGVRVAPQEVVPVTQIIAYILQPGEALSELSPSLAPVDAGEIPEEQGGRQVQVTPVAQRLAVSHEVDLSGVVGTGAGGRITKADVELALSADQRFEGERATPVLPPLQPAEALPGKVRATPAARRIAEERGVDLTAVTGSGPRGRIQVADLLALTPATRPPRTSPSPCGWI